VRGTTRALFFVVVVGLLTAPFLPAARAATPGAGPRLVLRSQDPWTPVGGDARLGLQVDGPPSEATVIASVGQAITSRNQYDQLAFGAAIPSVLGQVSVPLALLPSDADGVRTLALGLQSPTEARDSSRLNIRRPGVYPLDVELRDADEQPVASLRTMLVVTEADRPTVAEPLRVAWVWPVTAPPSFLPDGEPDHEVMAALRPNGRLGRMATALASVPDVPVTLAPTAELVEAWADAAREDPAVQSTFDALQRAAADRLVLDGPYVPVDVPALLDHGLSDAVDDVLTRGREILAAALGAPVETGTRLLRPASPAALSRLRAGGTDRFVVPGDALAPAPETRFTLAQPVTLPTVSASAGAAPVTALATDTRLEAILTADLSSAQRAQLILGGLAVVALETPSVTRVVTLANPDDFDPPADLYARLLSGLRANPYLRPVTTTEAFASVPADPPAPTVTSGLATSSRELTATPTSEPAVSALAYQSERARLNSFGALTRPGDPAVAVADRSLLASVSRGWPLDVAEARAEAHLGVVEQVIADFVNRIQVPDPRTITLTSRSGEIPLTFRNETGYPIRVRAALASEKLFFPEGSVLDLELPPKSTTVRVAVEARTSGTFPLDLEVTSTDGVLSISQRRLEVRSTFVSTVGVVLMVSAVTVLALWWGLDLRRRHRRRHRQPTTA
jgi:hypothetical protein